MNDIALTGCGPQPLAHYLKALAVLRLVSEQVDPRCRAWWTDDSYWLRSSSGEGQLADFFLNRYEPTPIVSPWNGGSGFFPGDTEDGISALSQSKAARFAAYRQGIEGARAILATLGVTAKPDKKTKVDILRSVRNNLPEKVLMWIDAAVLLADGEPGYPPLLGTGGNDGRLEFSNNFMQRLMDLFDPATGGPIGQAADWLRASLFAEPAMSLQHRKSIGQFFPGAVGGANATTGFSGESLLNPWDFVFTMEGALVFAGAASRRLNAHRAAGAAAFPFTVRASGVGYESADQADENPRGEIWLPLWSHPATLAEVMALFAEGRSQLGRRQARNGTDFARAVAGLGVDRGITGFQRYAFHVRNGLAYFASPVGRWQVTPQPEVDLLLEIDEWLLRFREKAGAEAAPAGIRRSLHAIERAILDFCTAGGAKRLAGILIALGAAELALANSPRFRKESFLGPIPPLSRAWLSAADDGSPELRLAAAIASTGIRENMEPVHAERKAAWLDVDDHPRVVWGVGGDLVTRLTAILARRCLDSRKQGKELPLDGTCPAALGDVSAFVRGGIDDRRLGLLLPGLALLNWSGPAAGLDGPADPLPPTLFGLLKLVHLPGPFREVNIPWDPSTIARATAGDAIGASRMAARRLRGSGFQPLLRLVSEPPGLTRRVAAALLIPLADRDIYRLARMVLQPSEAEQEAL